ncbi:GTPase [Pseudomonas sp. F1_0610]|uniref:YcjF family protein n=1 Tax=Pseudomonas sp. F1_0610 TaxID=3114284 RepID=UPI0039C4A9BA
MKDFLQKIYQAINPEKDDELKTAFSYSEKHLPTLWLLGKTGTGKSSLIRCLTGLTEVEIGNGFQPCTQSAQRYIYPSNFPTIAFLDTRGLAEADYDASADIQACTQQSHALLILMRVDEPEQKQVLDALKQIKKAGTIEQCLVIHTGIDLIADDTELQHCIKYNQEQVKAILGDTDNVAVSFLDELKAKQLLVPKISQMLPILNEILIDQQHSDIEAENFQRFKTEVLWYAGAAGAADAVPAIGAVVVPTIQGKMLHSLAQQYGLPWDKQLLSEFIGALGTGFLIQQASRFGLRQLIKFIPVYGQVVGSVTAAAISYAVTYALGRVAAMYFYRKVRQEPVSRDDLKRTFDDTFTQMLTLREKS